MPLLHTFFFKNIWCSSEYLREQDGGGGTDCFVDIYKRSCHPLWLTDVLLITTLAHFVE